MDAQWAPLCEVTAYRILRNGFSIDINALTRVQFGAELDTGVVLIVSAGSRFVRDVEHTTPGIIDGLKDMAKDGRKSAPFSFFYRRREGAGVSILPEVVGKTENKYTPESNGDLKSEMKKGERETKDADAVFS
ncbi:hypothetical protein SAMD00023353_6600350 [Rosellinia necatrix]|uniref:Uncharacterized protein n=1 Tax=Rosellinia necatrix TaxID=77044 RepID=A0A1W2TU55_ROSNE|nr:hypothetical protein SAMD00023353_6600350 [Rosellinia necatrix]